VIALELPERDRGGVTILKNDEQPGLAQLHRLDQDQHGGLAVRSTGNLAQSSHGGELVVTANDFALTLGKSVGQFRAKCVPARVPNNHRSAGGSGRGG
jgi:hypothetical protein